MTLVQQVHLYNLLRKNGYLTNFSDVAEMTVNEVLEMIKE